MFAINMSTLNRMLLLKKKESLEYGFEGIADEFQLGSQIST